MMISKRLITTMEPILGGANKSLFVKLRELLVTAVFALCIVHASADPDNGLAIPTAQTNNNVLVRLGQLEAVDAPLCDRLIAIGYMIQYPWLSSSNPLNDNAMANLGQVKNFLIFDLLATAPFHDTGVNGFPDWWEKYYFCITGVNPGSTRAGNTLTNLQMLTQGLNPTVTHQSGTSGGQSLTPQINYAYNSPGRLISNAGRAPGKS